MWHYDSSKTEKENMEACVLAFPDLSVKIISAIFLVSKEALTNKKPLTDSDTKYSKEDFEDRNHLNGIVEREKFIRF